MVDRSRQILEQLLEVVGVGGVKRCCAKRLELERSLLQPFGVAADQHHEAAACAYLASGFESDTRAAADHHNGLIGEVRRSLPLLPRTGRRGSRRRSRPGPARPARVRLADAVTEAVVEQYANAGEREHDALLMITSRAALRDAFLDTTAGIESPLAAVIAERLGDAGAHTARVLAASVAAAVRIALEDWLRPAGNAGAAGSFGAGGLVVPAGWLPDQLRAALAPIAPAFDAAERRTQP